MNSHSHSIKILLRVWLAALFMNTLLGTAVLTDFYTYADMIGPIAFLGFFYAAVFTIPFVSLLFVCLRLFVRMELSGKKLFVYFLSTGVLLTVGSFTIFFLAIGGARFPIWSLLLVAVGSGIVAMLLEYRPVLQLKKDEEEKAYDGFLR